MAAAVNARRCYAIACACLLIAAVALRFYNLQGAALRYDEVLVTLISRGALSDVIDDTRHIHQTPILYPLALWIVQKAAVSEFSVRLMSAVASALTVAALLFLMPRMGVPRQTAFLAALLATLSPAAIEHAQDAREYSADALVAVLIIAGLLQYLRNGGKALLCAALFVTPLLQYGLALLAVAALGVAAIAPAAYSQTDGSNARRAYAAVWQCMKRRIALLLPIACFAAACAISWALTVRYHLNDADKSNLPSFADYYYQGSYDAAAIFEFAISRTWELLSYHMPMVVAATALLAFGALLASLLKRRRLDALALLALIAIGIAICAALIDAYPFGGTRHGFYLGPIVFLAAGRAFHSVAVDAAAIARRKWLAPAIAVAAAAAIAGAGATAIYQYRHYLYYSDPSAKQALAALVERAQEGDAVYVSRWEVPAVEFYKSEQPANYFYGKAVCWGPSWAECVPEMLDEMFSTLNNSRRIWLIHNASAPIPKEIAAYSQEAGVEEVAANGLTALHKRQVDSLPTPHYDRQADKSIKRRNHNSWPRPYTTLHLITNFHKLAANIRNEWIGMHEDAVSGAPNATSTYNLFLQDNALYYAKRPCAPADTEAPFFLHLYPANADDLPSRRRQYGFDNLDFDFRAQGVIVDDKCVIRRDLPEYAIERIHTGQFVLGGDVVWEVELAGEP